MMSLCLIACQAKIDSYPVQDAATKEATITSPDTIPAYRGNPYIEINGNIPYFTEEDKTTEAFESYSELDSLGRCGVCFANIGPELMPTQERGEIGHIKPSGWQIAKYDFVDGKYLYNRCHLIGYQLTGENANEKNLITGTRYMNVQGMLPFENMVADYIRSTGNHVLYRVTPVFEGENTVASGVRMEASSVEDDGMGISFHIYIYNCQPGVVIDYATGISALGETRTDYDIASSEDTKYILNINTHKFHDPSCSSVDDMKDKNKQEYRGNREYIMQQGYKPCKICNP